MMPAVPRLFITWQEPESRRIYPIARLMHLSSGEFELSYIRAALVAREHGFSGLPGFEELDRVYVSRELPALFEHRPPQRGRRVALPGSLAPLAAPANDALDPAPIVLFVPRADGQGQERLEAFAPPLPLADGRYFGVFVVRGVGRVPGSSERLEALDAREVLRVVAEPTNAYNPRAAAVLTSDGATLGYLPDYLANEIAAAGAKPDALGVQLAGVQRINHPPAVPLYQVTCRYTCDASLGRALFASSDYQPLSLRAARMGPV